MSYRPDFIDNSEGNKLSEAIAGHLKELSAKNNTPEELCIATAYFRPQAMDLLQDSFKGLKGIRLLIGAEPLPAAKEEDMLPGDADTKEEYLKLKAAEAAEELIRRLKHDRDRLPFSKETQLKVERFVKFLETNILKARQVTKGFMHAKAYVFRGKGEQRGFIAGSSNLTPSGLTRNAELNLGIYEGDLPEKVETWFDKQWNEAADLDLAEIYRYLLEAYPPYYIYIKVLSEIYGTDVLREDGDSKIPVTEFQRHGVWRALKIIDELNGAIIADSVGLGKTFTAGAIIEKYNQRRQRVLVICPAAVRDTTWKKFLSDYHLLADIVSYEQLALEGLLKVPPEKLPKVPFMQQGGSAFGFGQNAYVSNRAGLKQDKLERHPDEYALVVIDEAHNYRNPYTPTRAAVLRNLLWGQPKDVLMLTATPVNNSLWDLFNMLRFFVRQDAQFAARGIPSLHERFDDAMSQDPNNLNPDELYPIIDATTVKRTRAFIKKYYPNEELKIRQSDGSIKLVPIVFPKPEALVVRYSFEKQLGPFFNALERCLAPADGGEPTVKFARYQADSYLKESPADGAKGGALLGLIRSGLLKRLESSAFAFHMTVSRMVKEHEIFVHQLEKGRVVTTQTLRDASTVEDDLSDADTIQKQEKAIAEGEFESADLYEKKKLLKDVESDLKELKVLRDMVREAANTERDDKLDSLINEIIKISAEAESEVVSSGGATLRDRRKILIFSYFADTAEWIHKRLEKAIREDARLAAYRESDSSLTGQNKGLRLCWVSGGDDSDISAKTGAACFAPITVDVKGAVDLFDILITTDVLAEGVNLQQARHIINYDLPWNPMRLVQRHGRIDRIGSKHTHVYLRAFFPDDRLDGMLQLQQRINSKIAMARASVGLTSPLATEHSREADFTEGVDVIKGLEGGDASIYEDGGTAESSQTAEQYRQELRKALSGPIDPKKLEDMPGKAWSGLAKGKTYGYFFLAKVRFKVDRNGVKETEQRHYLRFVETDKDYTPLMTRSLIDGKAIPVLEHREAACLRKIECTPEDNQQISPAAQEAVYTAWDLALDSISRQWDFYTDPMNTAPKVSRINSKAAELIRDNLGAEDNDLSKEDKEKALRIVLSPWTTRDENVLRTWVNSTAEGFTSLSKHKHAQLLVKNILSMGLSPATPADILPPITKDNIDLVCWMALEPAPAAQPK
jgi:hypothetical protein